MPNLVVLLICVIVATAAFIWLTAGVLSAFSWPIARLGSLAHDTLKLKPGNDQDAWLFVLLISVTRVLVTLLGALTFTAALSVALLPVPEIVPELRNGLWNIFIMLFIMRMAAIFVASAMLGGSVRTVLKTLKG
ncbi:MAG TPA: hypothetical protein VLA04_01080 [Verrucomicrobiae bacterium]|nr:hypothetical protein [Verrucomicrobiae bacterium]